MFFPLFTLRHWSQRSDVLKASHLTIYPGLEPVISKLKLTAPFTELMVVSDIFVELFRKKITDFFSGVSLIHLIISFPSHTYSESSDFYCAVRRVCKA